MEIAVVVLTIKIVAAYAVAVVIGMIAFSYITRKPMCISIPDCAECGCVPANQNEEIARDDIVGECIRRNLNRNDSNIIGEVIISER